jgi:dephospho-CoA kinase
MAQNNYTPSPFEIWGLTGGIASGKSSAALIFKELGFPVLDADRIARELSAPDGAAHSQIVARFGTADRNQLRERVFADPAARKDLEAILHPLIQSESLRRMEALAAATAPKKSGPLRILYEAALLVETGRYKQMAGLIVVDAPRELRRNRLIERDGFAPELADQILGAQISDEARLAAASAVIPNRGTIEDMRSFIEGFVREKGWG